MEKDPEKIIATFEKRKIRQTIGFLMLLTPPVLYPILGSYVENKFYVLLLFPVIWGLLGIFFFINWRCPSCKQYLGGSLTDLSPTSCSNCGAHFIRMTSAGVAVAQAIDVAKLYPELLYPKPRNSIKDAGNYISKVIIYLSLCGYPLVSSVLDLLGPHPRLDVVVLNFFSVACVFLLIYAYTIIESRKIKRILSIGDPVMARVEFLRWQIAGRARSIQVSYSYGGQKFEKTMGISKSVSLLPGDPLVLVVDPHDPSAAIVYTDCGYHVIGGPLI